MMFRFGQRFLGASRLQPLIYEEVEADRGALGQSIGVVIISSLAGGIGLGRDSSGLLAITLAGIIGWLFWAWITFLIGTRILSTRQTEADWGQLLRTTGFAAAPGTLRVLGIFFPGLTGPIFLVSGVWMLAAFVVAVRQALDYANLGRALAVCLFGWFAYLSFFLILDRLVLY